MISKVFGVFSIKTKFYASMNFMIMENVTRMMDPRSMKVTFDLKGSTLNRQTKLTSKFWNTKLNYAGVLKDKNFT